MTKRRKTEAGRRRDPKRTKRRTRQLRVRAREARWERWSAGWRGWISSATGAAILLGLVVWLGSTGIEDPPEPDPAFDAFVEPGTYLYSYIGVVGADGAVISDGLLTFDGASDHAPWRCSSRSRWGLQPVPVSPSAGAVDVASVMSALDDIGLVQVEETVDGDTVVNGEPALATAPVSGLVPAGPAGLNDASMCATLVKTLALLETPVELTNAPASLQTRADEALSERLVTSWDVDRLEQYAAWAQQQGVLSPFPIGPARELATSSRIEVVDTVDGFEIITRRLVGDLAGTVVDRLVVFERDS